MFNQICEVLGIGEVQLSDMVGFRTSEMFSTCVADEKTRKLLLRSAKGLRDVEEF